MPKTQTPDSLVPSQNRIARLAALSFVTGFSGAIMPGPLLVYVIQQTSAQGLAGVIGPVTGHALLEFATVGLLLLGLQAVIRRRRVRGTIGIIGGLALVWMGVDMLRNVAGLSLETSAAEGVAHGWGRLMVWGAVICIANPYFTGWWATIGTGQLAHAGPRTAGEYLAFYLGHEASDYAWYLVVGIIIVTGSRWMSDGVYRGLIGSCAVLIALIGVWFLVTGTRLWMESIRDAL